MLQSLLTEAEPAQRNSAIKSKKALHAEACNIDGSITFPADANSVSMEIQTIKYGRKASIR